LLCKEVLWKFWKCRMYPHQRDLFSIKRTFGPALGRFAYKDCTLIQWYLPWLCTVLLCTDCQRIARSIRASPAVLQTVQWLVTVAATLCTCAKKCNNMTSLLLCVSDWPIIMIVPSGSLLVVLHILLSHFHFYGWGCKKVNNETWMRKIFMQGSILSTAEDAL
jgi:hypothetical protein